jgi:hypothetical protein
VPQGAGIAFAITGLTVARIREYEVSDMVERAHGGRGVRAVADRTLVNEQYSIKRRPKPVWVDL